MIRWRKYGIVIIVVAGILLLYTMIAREPTKTKHSIMVELDIFSGRPNPSWELSAEDASELAVRMTNLTLAGKPPVMGGLGYRGFVISNPDKIEGLPIQIQIYKRTITTTEKELTNYYEDINSIESWLLEHARKSGYGDLIDEAIKNKSK